MERKISTILPIPVAKALREKTDNNTSILLSSSLYHNDVSILFAEIVDFDSHIALMLSPDETVIFLNRIYMIFDRLIDTHKLEKIKTVGPIIVIAGILLSFLLFSFLFLIFPLMFSFINALLLGGLNMSADEHLRRLVDLGIDMIIEMDRLTKRIPLKTLLRIGINSGMLLLIIKNNNDLFIVI